MREVVEFVRPEAAHKGLRVSIASSQAATLQMATDGPKLRRILLNLAGNATKYTVEGGVEVAACIADDHLVLDVRDTGPGIPVEHLERIWEPFTRVDAKVDRESSGTGLGLAIVKSLVELMSGQVSVSTAIGQGTTFTVRLPVGTPPA
jgi:signal transduction histidine kinase